MKKRKGFKMIVARFIDFVEEKNLLKQDDSKTIKEVEELLRVSLCEGLGLQVVHGDLVFEDYVDECKNKLFEGVDISKMNTGERQAFLQACLQVFHKVELVGDYI